MSITLKHDSYNVKNNISVTGYNVYRSDVSREDCLQSQTVYAEIAADGSEYVDEAVTENKLYWYRIDAVTEYGVAKGRVRAAQWVRNYGVGTGEFMFGDNECGVMACADTATLTAFRELTELRFNQLLVRAGITFSNVYPSRSPWVHGVMSINGECIVVPASFPSAASPSDPTTVIDNILKQDRVFSFNGDYYVFDVLTAQELEALNKFESAPYDPARAEALSSYFTPRATSLEAIGVRPAVTSGFGSNIASKYCVLNVLEYPVRQRMAVPAIAAVNKMNFIARLIR